MIFLVLSPLIFAALYVGIWAAITFTSRDLGD